MARPRVRHHNLPSRIDPNKVPTGLYWDASGNGRWFVLEAVPGGKKKRVTVAGPNASLADLHSIIEARETPSGKGSLKFVLDAFHDSLDFKRLGKRTQDDYKAYGKQICAYTLRNGVELGGLQVKQITPPAIRKLIDAVAQGRDGAPGYPTKANHWLRYLYRALNWGIEQGECTSNPAHGVRKVPEKADPRMPEEALFRKVQSFCFARGQRGAREKGSLPAYLWAGMEVAYQARLRGIEVLTLTDAHDLGDELRTNRRKGSRDNEVAKGILLAEAIDAMRQYRATIWERRRFPTPLRPEDRYLFVSEDGTPLSRDGWNTTWGRMMRLAVEEGVLTQEQRFGLHGLKHRGITDTDGNWADKKQAGGHLTDAMAHRYNHAVPRVEPAKDR